MPPSGDGPARRTLVFGAGDGGAQIARSIRQSASTKWQVCGFLDDDPRKIGTKLGGLEVLGGRADLASIVERLSVEVLIIAAPSYSEVARDVAGAAHRCGLVVKVVPPLEELLRDWVDVRDVRDLNLDDLLGRRHVEMNVRGARQCVAGRTVLVTGAGGSIGRELCRQLSSMEPHRLVMLDRDESALHGTSLALGMGGRLDRPEFVLADIRDARRIDQVLREEQPDVVFHAAALKHVQSLERHPGEAIQTNVWGTLNVLRASSDAGVDRFVNISTDKAAEPANALGCSKRVAEGLTSWFGQSHAGQFVSTRFGNVLGSRGSVLETFTSQLANGEPLTVSHPDAMRFLMAIDEAVGLVIQAAAIGSSGEVLVLDMGAPVRILDIAEHLVAAAGGRGSIEFTGLADGEKASEVLLAEGEEGMRPFHPLVTHVSVPALDPARCSLLDPWCSPDAAHRQLVDLAYAMAPAAASSRAGRGVLGHALEESVGNAVEVGTPQAGMDGY